VDVYMPTPYLKFTGTSKRGGCGTFLATLSRANSRITTKTDQLTITVPCKVWALTPDKPTNKVIPVAYNVGDPAMELTIPTWTKSPYMPFKRIQANFSCPAEITSFEDKSSGYWCSKLCKAKAGCKYFIHSKANVINSTYKKTCKMVKLATSSCKASSTEFAL